MNPTHNNTTPPESTSAKAVSVTPIIQNPAPQTDAAPAGRNLTPASVKRHKLVIAYDGTDFHGWQIQKTLPDMPPIRSVAGVIQDALRQLYKEPVILTGASRTDAGVHALGQVAHFDATARVPIERVPLAINSRLPQEIDILTAEFVHDDFDAISHAVKKQYRYRVFNARRRPLHMRNQVYHCLLDLDENLMEQACRIIEGTHDFAGFTIVNHGRQTTVRTVLSCHVQTVGQEVQFVVVGTGFLYNMVRVIAGTLLDVGRGRLTLDDVRRAIETQDRRSAGETLPASGLWLEWIEHRSPA